MGCGLSRIDFIINAASNHPAFRSLKQTPQAGSCHKYTTVKQYQEYSLIYVHQFIGSAATADLVRL